MSIPEEKTYPRTGDAQTIYLNAVITNPKIKTGDYTIYNDFVNNPINFEKNNGVISLPDQSGPVNYCKILFHCLRCKVHFYQCQSYLEVVIDLSISVVLGRI